jgi:hypothetical protein
MRRMGHFVVSSIAVVAVGARCGSTAPSRGAAGKKTTVVCSAGGASSNQRPLVRFGWSGGVAGRVDDLGVRCDGRARLAVGPPHYVVVHCARLRDAELRRLEGELGPARPGFGKTYFPYGPVPDGFEFRIDAAFGSVVFGDGGKPVPRGLAELGAHLQAIVTRLEREPAVRGARCPRPRP